jgi:hypothetical protein
MANGTLGKIISVANQNVVPYTAPVNALFATVTLNLVNTGAQEANVRIAIGNGASPAADEYIEYGVILAANGGTLVRSCQILSASNKVFIFSDKATVVTRVEGLEELQPQS